MAQATSSTTARTYRLEIISPERVLLDTQVRSVQVPCEDGSIGVLAGHAPLVAPVVPGALAVVDASGRRLMFAVGQGFIEVAKERTRILVDSAEAPEQIDQARAQRALDRAQGRIAQRGEKKDIDISRAEIALARAKARLKVVTFVA